jgi:hypothetical protein
MQDYDEAFTEEDQAECDAWQQENDAAQQQHEMKAAWWAFVHDQERE